MYTGTSWSNKLPYCRRPRWQLSLLSCQQWRLGGSTGGGTGIELLLLRTARLYKSSHASLAESHLWWTVSSTCAHKMVCHLLTRRTPTFLYFSSSGLTKLSRSWSSLKSPAIKNVPPKLLARAMKNDGSLAILFSLLSCPPCLEAGRKVSLSAERADLESESSNSYISSLLVAMWWSVKSILFKRER